LYLDFINIFIHLLQLFGVLNSRDDWCTSHQGILKYSYHGSLVS
jgi:hypothetical protein